MRSVFYNLRLMAIRLISWIPIIILPLQATFAKEQMPTAVVTPTNPTSTTTFTAGPLTIEILSHYTPLAVGTSELNVILRIRADAATTTSRPPLDLAVVLDRSGSMAGDKLRDAKQAALDLLKLLEDRDQVTLITYDDQVVVHETHRTANANGKDAMRATILKVTDGGSTALGPALIKALELMESGTRSEKTVAHVALLSDGQANVGEMRPEVLGARTRKGFSNGVSVSTLGLGNDYNEELMTRLADQGGGRYHFIKDSSAITTILQEELMGLAATVAHSLVVQIQLNAGVKITKVFGYPQEQVKGEVLIPVGSMRAGQEREILIRLSLPPGLQNQVVLGQVTIRARDVRETGVDVTASGAITEEFTTDTQRVTAGERTDVTVRVAELEAVDQMDAATRESDAGRFDKAKELLTTTLTQVKLKADQTKSPKLQRQVEEIEQAVIEMEKVKNAGYEQQKSFGRSVRGISHKSRK